MKAPLIAFGVLLAAGVPLAVTAQQSAAPIGSAPQSNIVVLENCLISLVGKNGEADVPAEEAGVLREICVEEGEQVTVGKPQDPTTQPPTPAEPPTLLAQIDDIRAQLQLKVAAANLNTAITKANNMTAINYAKRSSEVAAAEWNQAKDANEGYPGTITEAEMKRLLLTWHKTLAEIDQAEMNKKIAEDEAKVSVAEQAAAEEGVKRRKITSPLDGVVVKVYGHEGEWVQPGDAVVHVIRLDRLRIEGFLKMSQWAPAEVDKKPVTVSVELERDRRETFQGRVIFANPMFESGGEYQVWAEIDNRRDPTTGKWMLGPGLMASMMIHMPQQ